MKKISRNRGFTLIEILIVIGIIAILATLVLVAINPAKQFRQANDTQRTANVNTILNAVGQFMADNRGRLPSGIATTTVAISSDGAGVDFCNDLIPTYIPALPVDPLSGGETIKENSCDEYETGYTIEKDSTNRVTVSAPGAEELKEISTTR